MAEQVKPVVRPLLATPIPMVVFALVTIVADGGASLIAVGVVVGPSSRIVPALSTVAAEFICAMAASTLLGATPQKLVSAFAQRPPVIAAVGLRAACCVNVATLLVPEKHCTAPGCAITSPFAARLERASTWLLLRMNFEAPR